MMIKYIKIFGVLSLFFSVMAAFFAIVFCWFYFVVSAPVPLSIMLSIIAALVIVSGVVGVTIDIIVEPITCIGVKNETENSEKVDK